MEMNQLEKIYQTMADNDFEEIELRLGSTDRIKMVKHTNNKNKTIAKEPLKDTASTTIKNKQNIKKEVNTNNTEIRSELVGVFQFMDDDENFFPKVGDEVAMGEKLGKIISLNSIKEIKSPIDGRIKEISVKKNNIVDYGHLLFVIEDSSIKA